MHRSSSFHVRDLSLAPQMISIPAHNLVRPHTTCIVGPDTHGTYLGAAPHAAALVCARRRNPQLRDEAASRRVVQTRWTRAMSALNQAYEPSAALLFGFTLFVIGRLWLVRVPSSPLAGTQPGWYALRIRRQATSILDQRASCRSKSAVVPCCRFAVSFFLLVKP